MPPSPSEFKFPNRGHTWPLDMKYTTKKEMPMLHDAATLVALIDFLCVTWLHTWPTWDSWLKRQRPKSPGLCIVDGRQNALRSTWKQNAMISKGLSAKALKTCQNYSKLSAARQLYLYEMTSQRSGKHMISNTYITLPPNIILPAKRKTHTLFQYNPLKEYAKTETVDSNLIECGRKPRNRCCFICVPTCLILNSHFVA